MDLISKLHFKKKNMKTKFTKLLLVSLITLFSVGCETIDLEQQDNPSRLTPESSDPDLLLNSVLLNFEDAIAYNEDNEDGVNVRAAEAVRMQHLFGSYAGPFSLTSGSIDDIWDNFYLQTLQDISLLLPLAEQRDLNGHIGIAKIIQAYTYVTLVDIFGNVPYTQANQGNAFPEPVADSGQDIYNAMLIVLDEAMTSLNLATAASMPSDLFYAGDIEKWLRVARTLKFKMYVQMRLLPADYSSQINALISQGLIETVDQDFQFAYSNTVSPGDSRHPYYTLNYDADGSDDYLNSYYVYLLKDDKGFNDPRLRYYFYRQVNSAPTGDNLDCGSNPNFCYLGDFYWTRDHGNDLGVPPDQLLRSTYGLYPIGGAFDADNFVDVTQNIGAQGTGIFPFMLSSYVKFLMAESALMSGTTGNPRTLLQEAITDSMNKVVNFLTSSVDSSFAASQAEIDNYINIVLSSYDAATNDEERLAVIIKEYYIALWGNGIEAYNNYRRTSYPSDISPHIASPGEFPRSFMYPSNEVNTNANISQKPITEKVFWDLNTDNLN